MGGRNGYGGGEYRQRNTRAIISAGYAAERLAIIKILSRICLTINSDGVLRRYALQDASRNTLVLANLILTDVTKTCQVLKTWQVLLSTNNVARQNNTD